MLSIDTLLPQHLAAEHDNESGRLSKCNQTAAEAREVHVLNYQCQVLGA
jgi:hypothetical protein